MVSIGGRSRRIFVFGAMVTSFAACRCERPGTSPPVKGEAGAAVAVTEIDAGAPAAVLLLNDESIEQAMWTADGAVVGFSRQRFWWFRPDDGGRAQTTLLGGADRQPHIAVAKNKDVSVVTVARKAHVFHGPKEVSSFETFDGDAQALSSDGAVLLTLAMEHTSRGSMSIGSVYDVATGKRLSVQASSASLSPAGEWVMAKDGIQNVRTNERVVELPEWPHSLAEESPWFDGGAMAWTDSGLVVADPKARTVVNVPAKCTAGEIDEIIEAVDTTTKQALRFCGSRVFVVRVETGSAASVVEVPIPASRKGARPGLGFARDDGAPLVVWGFPVGAEVDRIDPSTRSMTKAATGIERMTARTTDNEGAPSPDGRYRLRVESFMFSAGAVTVRDTAGKEVVHFGVTTSITTNDVIAPFVHEHGLDVIVGDGATAHRVRIGPDAAPRLDLPLLSPAGPACEGKANPMMAPVRPQRTLTGDSAIFAWPSGGSCVCVHGGCADPHLPDGALARSDEKLIASEPSGKQVTYLEKRKERGSTALEGELRGATFLDDGTSAALLTRSVTLSKDTWRVSEVKLPSFEKVGTPVEIEHPFLFGWDYSLSGTKDSIAVVLSDRYVLKGWIIPRGSSDAGAPKPTRIEGWDDNAVVTLPDGRMDLYGPAADRALVCVDGLGAVTPFATCRSRFEAKGAFRID